METKQVWDALQLFAFGVYTDFIAQRTQLPALSDSQLNKLRQMTIVSLASRQKHLPYAVLLSALGLTNVRQLEDLIIEAIYADILQGKLDQKNQTLEVNSAIGRDVKPEDLANFTTVLTNWCDRWENFRCWGCLYWISVNERLYLQLQSSPVNSGGTDGLRQSGQKRLYPAQITTGRRAN